MSKLGVEIPLTLPLQQVLKQIRQLESSLESVKPNTKAYDYLSKQIDKTRKKYALVAAEAKKTFTSPNEISRFLRHAYFREIHFFAM